MIVFSLDESLRAFLAFVIYAAILCLLYEAFSLFFQFAATMFSKNEYYVYKKGNNIKKAAEKIRSKLTSCGGRWIECYRFFFTLIFGLGYLVIQYAFCDGVFRFYFLICSLVTFLLTKRVYKHCFYAYALGFTSYFCAILIFISSMLITPVYILSLKLIRGIKSLFMHFIKIGKRQASIARYRQKRRR